MTSRFTLFLTLITLRNSLPKQFLHVDHSSVSYNSILNKNAMFIAVVSQILGGTERVGQR